MARPRSELDIILRAILGTTNVYFDPPESFKMNYPCIIYSDSGDYDIFADNKEFIERKRYTLIYITKNADDPTVETIKRLRHCRRSTPYVTDGLRHHPFTIYF